MKIVTAADQQYFSALINLVGSIHYWAPELEILIYDLGLTEAQRLEVQKWRAVELAIDFDLGTLPEHCRVLKKYAWKPLALADAINRYPAILWIDAGSDFRASPGQIRSRLESDGHFFVQGQDLDMTEQSHEASYRALRTEKPDFSGRPHYAGNLQGYVRSGPAHKQILRPLYHCAMEENCIAPHGSSLANHRFDQTALSILIYLSGLKINAATCLLAADRAQLNPSPMQASTHIVYTARGSSIEYARQLKDRDNQTRFPNAPKNRVIHNQASE